MSNFFKYNSSSKYQLIGKINGLAASVRRTRFRLVKRAKAKKPIWVLASRKRTVGVDIRHHLLAYAFMRGTPYHQLERKCREDNKPSAAKILEIVLYHTPYSAGWTLEKVEKWLGSSEEQ